MQEIQKKFIVDEHDKRVAVQIDIDTFEKMEEVMENYGLIKLMNEQDDNEVLSLNEAKVFYKTLSKVD